MDTTLDGPWPGDPEFVNVVPVAPYATSYAYPAGSSILRANTAPEPIIQ